MRYFKHQEITMFMTRSIKSSNSEVVAKLPEIETSIKICPSCVKAMSLNSLDLTKQVHTTNDLERITFKASLMHITASLTEPKKRKKRAAIFSPIHGGPIFYILRMNGSFFVKIIQIRLN